MRLKREIINFPFSSKDFSPRVLIKCYQTFSLKISQTWRCKSGKALRLSKGQNKELWAISNVKLRKVVQVFISNILHFTFFHSIFLSSPPPLQFLPCSKLFQSKSLKMLTISNHKFLQLVISRYHPSDVGWASQNFS